MVRLFPLAMLALLAACTLEEPIPPGETFVVVHAVLDPSKSVQVVNLEMTEGAKVSQTYLDRADVKLTLPDGRVLTARQDSVRDSTGKFLGTLPDYRIDLATAGATLVQGGTYKLRVATQAGDVVTGETTIPSAAPVTPSAATNFFRLVDTLRLSWSAVPGARTFEVQVWSKEVFDYCGSFCTFAHLQYTSFRDSSIALAGTAKYFDDDVFPRAQTSSGTHSYVYVLAVDDNYYAYYRQLGDPFRGAAPTRLEGGIGVFGSVVPVIQRELIVK
jgi:hypothetical protein